MPTQDTLQGISRFFGKALDEAILRARLRLVELSISLSLEDFLRAALDEAEDLTLSVAGYYGLVTGAQATGELTARSTKTLERIAAPGGVGGVGDTLGGGVGGDCVRQRRPIVRNGNSGASVAELAVPVFRGDHIVAVVVVQGKPTGYDARDIELVSLLADLTWDIAERKRAEVALRASEANYREVFDKANDGVLIHDIQTGQMLDANRKIYEMYGYTAEEMRALKIGAISSNEPPYTQTTALKWIRKAARDESQLFEWLARDRNGRLFWVEVNLKKARIGGQERLLGIVRDISERKRTESETERLRETLAHVSRVSTLGELAASLAHELNQPLAAIVTNTHAALRMLRNGSARNEDIEEILADIAADGGRAGEIIRRMREPLRRGELTVEPLFLYELIRDICELVRNDALLAGVTIETETTPGLPFVSGDRIQLQQVLLNLMMNALDAVRDQPADRRRVQMVASAENHRSVRLEVSDMGTGIAESKCDSVFEPFCTSKPSGLGLGLTICRTLVEAHGGRIWAEPAPEGGARLVVVLPADQGDRR